MRRNERPGRQTVLVLSHASYGHLKAFTHIMQTINDAGYQVTVCTSRQAQPYLSKAPFRTIFIDILPFATNFEGQMELGLGKGRYYQKLLLRKSRFLYMKRRYALETVLKQEEPFIVLVDALYTTDIALIYKWCEEHKARIRIMRSKPGSTMGPDLPPLNSTYIGCNKLKNKLLWYRHMIRKMCRGIWDFIKYQGYDDHAQILRSLKELPTLRKNLIWYGSIGCTFTNIEELVLLPTSFELPGFEPNGRSHYVGFQYLSRENSNSIPGPAKTDVQNPRQVADRQHMIYIAFGTLHRRYRLKIKRLIKKIWHALDLIDKKHVILSLADEEIVSETPDYAKAYDFVDQPAVLQQADLFITHGGINSIKDAIYTTTPMLVYPLNPNWDQIGNAARITVHGMGLRGNTKKDSPSDIFHKVNALLTDKTIRENITAFRKIDEQYGPDKIITALSLPAAKEEVHKKV